MRPLVVLRPEPALSATRARAEAIGLTVVACPLFTIEPLDWARPNPAEFDALLLTSANTLRRAGELGPLKTLPVVAVGEATAEAARDAGLSVEMIGSGGVDALLAAIPGAKRLLHLAGEPMEVVAPPVVIRLVIVDRGRPLRRRRRGHR